jgi:succinate dehydrogenase/fumarate reductase flavoprotein subunit
MLPYYVLHIKKADRLQAALTNVAFFRDHMLPRLKANDPHELRLCHEVRSMTANAEMILRSSLAREESRGWHYREDFPTQDDEHWLAWVTLRQGDAGMEAGRREIPAEWLAGDPTENRYDKKWLAWEQEVD